MTDPLADFWVHDTLVRRWVGTSAYGDVYDPPMDQPAETVRGWVRDGVKLLADGTGGQVASSAQVAYPPSTAYIPLKSLITLPPKFAVAGQTRTSEVVASARADGGGLPTPDHVMVGLR